MSHYRDSRGEPLPFSQSTGRDDGLAYGYLHTGSKTQSHPSHPARSSGNRLSGDFEENYRHHQQQLSSREYRHSQAGNTTDSFARIPHATQNPRYSAQSILDSPVSVASKSSSHSNTASGSSVTDPAFPRRQGMQDPRSPASSLSTSGHHHSLDHCQPALAALTAGASSPPRSHTYRPQAVRPRNPRAESDNSYKRHTYVGGYDAADYGKMGPPSLPPRRPAAAASAATYTPSQRLSIDLYFNTDPRSSHTSFASSTPGERPASLTPRGSHEHDHRDYYTSTSTSTLAPFSTAHADQVMRASKDVRAMLHFSSKALDAVHKMSDWVEETAALCERRSELYTESALCLSKLERATQTVLSVVSEFRKSYMYITHSHSSAERKNYEDLSERLVRATTALNGLRHSAKEAETNKGVADYVMYRSSGTELDSVLTEIKGSRKILKKLENSGRFRQSLDEVKDSLYEIKAAHNMWSQQAVMTDFLVDRLNQATEEGKVANTALSKIKEREEKITKNMTSLMESMSAKGTEDL